MMVRIGETNGPQAFGVRGGVPGPTKRLGVAAAFVDGRLVDGDVAIRGGEIEAIGVVGSGDRGSRPGGVAIPGLLDAQVNGYAGVDVLAADHEQLKALGAALRRDGVSAYQPTMITAPEDQVIAALGRIASLPEASDDEAAIVGAHLEGPFLSPRRPGAHPVEHLRPPDVGLLQRLLDAGPVSMVTLAPELPGALELIQLCTARGVVVSLGHSEADAEDVERALAAGAAAVTHLFNAMAPLSARAPGLAGAALASENCEIQLIADGVHVADDLVRLAFTAAPGRCSVVSDAIAAASLGDGSYRLGPIEVEVREGVARRSDGTLAGGVASLAASLPRLRRLGVEPADAISAVTARPAQLLLGRERSAGLRTGDPADVVVLDDDHRIRTVLARGSELERPAAGVLA
jgi:N-acetylglucosamine-6-phosphate deacetylase